MLETFDKETFDGRLGERFRIALDEGTDLELVLSEVSGVTAGEVGKRSSRAFSLLFRGGPSDRYLPQRTYELHHDELGTLAIFLVPLGPTGDAMQYQAVFT